MSPASTPMLAMGAPTLALGDYEGDFDFQDAGMKVKRGENCLKLGLQMLPMLDQNQDCGRGEEKVG